MKSILHRNLDERHSVAPTCCGLEKKSQGVVSFVGGLPLDADQITSNCRRVAPCRWPRTVICRRVAYCRWPRTAICRRIAADEIAANCRRVVPCRWRNSCQLPAGCPLPLTKDCHLPAGCSLPLTRELPFAGGLPLAADQRTAICWRVAPRRWRKELAASTLAGLGVPYDILTLRGRSPVRQEVKMNPEPDRPR